MQRNIYEIIRDEILTTLSIIYQRSVCVYELKLTIKNRLVFDKNSEFLPHEIE